MGTSASLTSLLAIILFECLSITSASTSTTSAPDSWWNWYYLIPIILGGIVLIIVLIAMCYNCCWKGRGMVYAEDVETGRGVRYNQELDMPQQKFPQFAKPEDPNLPKSGNNNVYNSFVQLSTPNSMETKGYEYMWTK